MADGPRTRASLRSDYPSEEEGDDNWQEWDCDRESDSDYVPDENVAPMEQATSKQTQKPKKANLSFAFSNRRRPYFPLKKDDRIRVIRDLLLTHRWQEAAKWLVTLMADTSVPNDLLYRQTMLVLEVNKPKDVPFNIYYSRTVLPLVKSFLTLDLNKREVLLDVCTLLCRNGLWNDAKELLEENNHIFRNAQPQAEAGSGKSRFRQNETIDSCVVCYKNYLGYVEWLSELDEDVASEHIEQLRDTKAQNLMTLLKSGINFSDSSNVDIFVFALHSMYDYYNMTQESLQLWDEFLEKCPNNIFAIIGFWNVLHDLLGSFEEQRLQLLEKLAQLDPSHPIILTMIQSGRLGSVTNDLRVKFASLVMDFVDYASNEPRKETAWKLLISLMEQMDSSSLNKVRSLYTFKYQSYWEYTHLKEPRGEEQETFAQLVLQTVEERESASITRDDE